jgi:hypothetical protein
MVTLHSLLLNNGLPDQLFLLVEPHRNFLFRPWNHAFQFTSDETWLSFSRRGWLCIGFSNPASRRARGRFNLDGCDV